MCKKCGFDYIIMAYRSNNGEHMEEVGVIADSDEDAILSAKDILFVNNGYSWQEVNEFDYTVELDKFQECDCQ